MLHDLDKRLRWTILRGRCSRTTPPAVLRQRHNRMSARNVPIFSADDGQAEAVTAVFSREGIDDGALAANLQREGAEAFTTSWADLMSRITTKRTTLTQSRRL